LDEPCTATVRPPHASVRSTPDWWITSWPAGAGAELAGGGGAGWAVAGAASAATAGARSIVTDAESSRTEPDAHVIVALPPGASAGPTLEIGTSPEPAVGPQDHGARCGRPGGTRPSPPGGHVAAGQRSRDDRLGGVYRPTWNTAGAEPSLDRVHRPSARSLEHQGCRRSRPAPTAPSGVSTGCRPVIDRTRVRPGVARAAGRRGAGRHLPPAAGGDAPCGSAPPG